MLAFNYINHIKNIFILGFKKSVLLDDHKLANLDGKTNLADYFSCLPTNANTNSHIQTQTRIQFPITPNDPYKANNLIYQTTD